MGDALQEHLNYLSDGIRLERFEQAVARAVAPGDSVADIGCGFGILGLLCLKAGAARVWGIDRTEALEIARETMARNGLAERYECIREVSFAAELPQPVDLVICDHVGYFGVDYGIVDAMGDARRRFLKPGGTIMPQRIVLQLAAAQSPACREMAGAWNSDPVPEEFRWLREFGVNSKHCHDFEPGELACAPVELGTVDLREDSPELLAFAARLEIDRACALDGLAGWFACELVDGVWMTNSPLADDQIKRTQVFLPFAAPLAVEAGDVLEATVSVRHETALIAWTARVARTGQAARQSTWASTILDPADRVRPAERIPRLSRIGEARRALLGLVDGAASEGEIERALLESYPDLYPTREQVARFIRAELHRSTR